MQEFEHKVAFIAGASGGINFAIAERLSALGVSVGLISRDKQRIEEAAAKIEKAGGKSIGIVADVRDYDLVENAVDAIAETFGEIDIVISGAAGNFLSLASDLSAKGFRTVVDIDLIGTFNVYRASLASLRKPGASLIAISAPQGARPFVQQIHACAAKAGVNMLTRVLALEWASFGIRVNAISPGPIGDTEGVRRLWPDAYAKERLSRDVPLQRLGSFDEIADAAVFLASSAAAYVTGTILDVDGGYMWGSSPQSMGARQ